MTKRKASVALETGNESNQSTSTQDNNSNSTSATINTTGPSNNTNQGAQNGSSSGSNNVGKHTSDGQHKSKKERADNWSSAEIQVLHRGIESRRDIFYGPPSQATKRNRELAWEAIAKEVNSVSTTPRTLSQVMKKFKNEKCRAKRKFIDSDKDGHNNIGNSGNVNSSNSNNGNSSNTNASTNLSAQNHNSATNNQQLQSQQQAHHMTTAESMSNQQSSINVVKLAPQNVAKTMIDLPGHVQQIQMPNDDMVLIVPQEMDGLLSGMNIVSDGNGHHQFQKCSSISTLNNQQHNNHGHHAIQAINTGQGLMNGAMSNSMMARTIPAGSMCSLVYSTGNEVCGPEQHIANNVTGPNQLSTNHISVNAQNLMHHRTTIDQAQGQQQQQQQPQQQHPHHHQLHQHQSHQTHQQQPQQPQPPQQQQPQAPHPSQHPQSHQPAQHHQPQLQQNHLTTGTTIANSGGAAVESQLKNLLFNLLLKDGQHLTQVGPSTPDYSKQRNDILAIIAGSLNKIEGHLCKISKVAGSLFAQNINSAAGETASVITSAALNSQSNNLANNDGNNNNVSITGTGSATGISNQGGSDG